MILYLVDDDCGRLNRVTGFVMGAVSHLLNEVTKLVVVLVGWHCLVRGTASPVSPEAARFNQHRLDPEVLNFLGN